MRIVPFVLLAACAGEHTFLPPDTTETGETGVVEETDVEETDPVDTSDTGTDEDHDGWTVEEGDCDDSTIWVNPAWPENAKDGIDNDCDGLIDEKFAGITLVDSGAGTALVDVNLLGETERTLPVSPAMTPGVYPPPYVGAPSAIVQIGPRVSGEGWSFTDGVGKVGEIDASGKATVLWDDSETEYADGEGPLGYYGIAAHPDGWYAVSGGDRLWRVDPDGTMTVLAQWDCLEGTEGVTEICPIDVAVDRFSGEVVLFGYFGGYAVWNASTGLDVAVLDNPDPYAPKYQFWSTQIVDSGARLAMGADPDGTQGIFEWDEDTETFVMTFEWVATDFTPVDFAVDQISRQYYATANRGWFVTAWRLVPGDTDSDPYMAMLTPRTVDPLNSDYVQPASDHDVQSLVIRYSYAP